MQPQARPFARAAAALGALSMPSDEHEVELASGMCNPCDADTHIASAAGAPRRTMILQGPKDKSIHKLIHRYVCIPDQDEVKAYYCDAWSDQVPGDVLAARSPNGYLRLITSIYDKETHRVLGRARTSLLRMNDAQARPGEVDTMSLVLGAVSFREKW